MEPETEQTSFSAPAQELANETETEPEVESEPVESAVVRPSYEKVASKTAIYEAKEASPETPPPAKVRDLSNKHYSGYTLVGRFFSVKVYHLSLSLYD